MSINLRIGMIIVGLLLLYITVIILKKGRMPVKYSLIWLFSSVLILLIGIVPSLFGIFAKLLGFFTISNMITGIFIFILLLITMSLTIIVSGQKKKITLLIQEISILKGKIDNKE